MACRLCGQEKLLIRKSHIIPGWMYKSLFTDGRKIFKFAPAQYITGNLEIQMPSDGEYEGGILCANCDNIIIGQYEDYASRVYSSHGLPEKLLPVYTECVSEGGIKYTLVNNLDYKRFKLFLLSILWRASISTRPFFKEVNLGPHEAILRRMILNGNPASTEDYPIMVLSYLNDSSVPGDLIGQPGKIKDEQGTCYIFIISGYTYIFYLSTHDIPRQILDSVINSNGDMKILHIPEGMAWNLITGYFGIKPPN
jgi:hypothetical protein